jgi:hypothetical protein
MSSAIKRTTLGWSEICENTMNGMRGRKKRSFIV